MRYIFFFSYARTNRDEYLMRFYKDLRRRVEVQLGLSAAEYESTQIAFLDERDLELGSEWEPELIEALQNSAVLVCAYSPSYFVSEYCSREWHVFQMRRREWPKFKNGEAPLPAAIKPVIWVSPTRRMTRATVHEDVWGVQYKLGPTDAIYNTDGVEPMLRMLNKYSSEYEAFIDELAKAIIAAADMSPALPLLGPPVPRLSDIAPLFPLRAPVPAATVAAPAEPALAPASLLFAAIGLAAGAAGELVNWRPFGAPGHCIDFLLQSIAVRDLNSACRIVHVTSAADLHDLIEHAALHYQTLVMLADPASAALLAREHLDFAGFPLLVLGVAGTPQAAPTMLASPDALRAVLVEQIPRLLSKTRSGGHFHVPSSISKPVISASSR